MFYCQAGSSLGEHNRLR